MKFFLIACFLTLVMAGCQKEPNTMTLNKKSSEVDTLAATWTLAEVVPPYFQVEYDMDYDTAHNVVVAFGGRSGMFKEASETFVFSPATKEWQEVETQNPSWRVNHSLVYNPGIKKFVLFGGSNFAQCFNDVWTYNHACAEWQEFPVDAGPEARQMHGMVFMPHRNELLLFGGRRLNGGAAFNDTWILSMNDTSWTRLEPSVSPPIQDHVNMAYNNADSNVYLFYGPEGEHEPATWKFDTETTTWHNLNPSISPRSDHAGILYNEAHNVLVLFGNNRSSGEMETWTYNVSTNSWMDVTPAQMPGGYIEHADFVYIPGEEYYMHYGGCCSDETLTLTLSGK